MRRPVYAATFVEDADKIAHYIETQFGITHADAFIDGLNRFCELVASQPGLGKQNHGYDVTLYGVVHNANWILFRYYDDEARFIHVVDARQHKKAIFF